LRPAAHSRAETGRLYAGRRGPPRTVRTPGDLRGVPGHCRNPERPAVSAARDGPLAHARPAARRGRRRTGERASPDPGSPIPSPFTSHKIHSVYLPNWGSRIHRACGWRTRRPAPSALGDLVLALGLTPRTCARTPANRGRRRPPARHSMTPARSTCSPPGRLPPHARGSPGPARGCG
jgi:hypothetical protein